MKHMENKITRYAALARTAGRDIYDVLMQVHDRPDGPNESANCEDKRRELNENLEECCGNEQQTTTPTKYNSLLAVAAITIGASSAIPAPIVIGAGALLFYLAYDVGHNDNSYLGLGKLLVAPVL